MRLTEEQIQVIKQTARQLFGDEVRVYLFGSRAYDNKKGGDIDLLIKTRDKSMATLKNKLLFIVNLKMKIGDQKIDVVFDLKGKYSGNFLDSIKKQSVEIC
ncbi:MAG TPA: nucleotidyltransferase domain-containing protein [Bacteroidetes bacterium]|nr:nucleotidyltransferase domain-containing protein [Bacteroidota bacterium]